MAARPIWRGHLRLALVSCPIALIPARHERHNLHFNLINPDTGNRVRMVTLDAETGEELRRGDLVRGFEFKKDHYVLMTDEDFERARIESSTVMTIEKFVPAASIDPLYFDSAYLVVPDGEAGIDVYAVLREAIARSSVLALARVVLFRRERAIALTPQGKGMVLHTLHEAEDLADSGDAFDAVPEARPDAAMVKLAMELIARQTGHYDPADVEDRYEARLRAVIDAKVAGTGIEPEEPDPGPPGNVIDLMEALKRSLGGKGARAGGKPAGSAAARDTQAPAAKAKPTRGKAAASGKAAPKPAARKRARA